MPDWCPQSTGADKLPPLMTLTAPPGRVKHSQRAEGSRFWSRKSGRVRSPAKSNRKSFSEDKTDVKIRGRPPCERRPLQQVTPTDPRQRQTESGYPDKVALPDSNTYASTACVHKLSGQ